MDVDIERAAEAKRQAVRKAMSLEERRHSEKVASVVVGVCVLLLVVVFLLVK